VKFCVCVVSLQRHFLIALSNPWIILSILLQSRDVTKAIEVCTIIEVNVVSTSSKNLSHPASTELCFGSFELHTMGIVLKLMKHMSYNGQGLVEKAKELKTTLKWNLSQNLKA